MLPLACISLMCGDIAFSQAISAFSSYGAGALAITLAVVTLALVLSAIAQLRVRQHRMVFPALVRS